MQFVNPNLYPALLLGVALFLLGRRLSTAAKVSRYKAWIYCLTLLLALVSLIIPLPYLNSVIGENPGYANFRALPFAELIICLAAPFPGWLSARCLPRNSALALVCLLGTLGYVSLPFIKPILRPTHTIASKWQDGIALQTTPSTCGPASLTTILTRYGNPTTEQEVAKGAFTSGSGTENWYLARYAVSKGFHYQFQYQPDLEQVPVPSIIGAKMGSYGHFITLLERQGNIYSIGDSLSGHYQMTSEEFQKKYQYTGFVLHIHKD